MKLIMGLGNPGEKYQGTRHNLGFEVVDELATSVQRSAFSWKMERKLKAGTLQINYPLDASSCTLILAKPQTYMNNSGIAAKLLTTYYKLPTTDLIVIHDDLDLPLGKIKIRQGGAGAGHKGVESIINSLGTDQFIRIRLGIGPDENLDSINIDHFVLEKFLPSEKAKVKRMVKEAAETLELLLKEGLEKTQNQYN